MAMPDYYATYCRFSTYSKDEAAVLLGADCCVGDVLQVHVEEHAVDPEGTLVNRFGATVGHINPDMAQQVLLCRAKGWEPRALLAAVYYTEPDRADDNNQQAGEKGPGYWGEVVIMAFSNAPAYRAFCDTVAQALGEGARPNVELGSTGASKVEESKGSWLPEGRVSKPHLAPGTAVVKDHLSFNEKLVEQARRRNPGCMAAGWAFIAVAVAALVWLALRLIGS